MQIVERLNATHAKYEFQSANFSFTEWYDICYVFGLNPEKVIKIQINAEEVRTLNLEEAE